MRRQMQAPNPFISCNCMTYWCQSYRGLKTTVMSSNSPYRELHRVPKLSWSEHNNYYDYQLTKEDLRQWVTVYVSRKRPRSEVLYEISELFLALTIQSRNWRLIVLTIFERDSSSLCFSCKETEGIHLLSIDWNLQHIIKADIRQSKKACRSPRLRVACMAVGTELIRTLYLPKAGGIGKVWAWVMCTTLILRWEDQYQLMEIALLSSWVGLKINCSFEECHNISEHCRHSNYP